MIKYQVLELLRAQSGNIVSGGELAQQLGVSRTAVWKAVVSLQEEGYQIVPAANKGYRFTESEIYSAHEIERLLDTHTIGRPVVFLPEVDSTNNYAKQCAAQGGTHGTAIVAAAQTAGRGRLGRNFSSPQEQGVYLTVLLRPKLTITDMMAVTLLAAVAEKETIEELTGVAPTIKWTNDVYLDGKKCCGILTEGSVVGESGQIDYLIIGIGTNLYQQPSDFPEELREIATSLLAATGKRIPRSVFVARLLGKLEYYFCDGQFPNNKAEVLRRYRDALFFLGKPVLVQTAHGNYAATALDIDEEGRLIVADSSGARQVLQSGEISVRPL
jgi:BirA family biotin operon repressor/biotin-[acetyl-CoA-carboxylase] ligase